MQPKTLHSVSVLLLLALLLTLAAPALAQDGPPLDISRSPQTTGGTDAPQPYTPTASFSEGFEDINNLPGWFLQNNSAPGGQTNWFQGNAVVFLAQAGSNPSYIAANFQNTTGTNTISNWMLTPQFNLSNGDTLSFWTRTVDSPAFPDRLQVRLSTAGASTNVGTLPTDVGDFSTLLLDINPALTTDGYPNVWTQYTITLSGLPPSASGRFAWRYFVTDGGPNGNNSDYIGIDTVEMNIALAVTLASFAAQGQDDRVVVAWETVSEMDNAGFNIYRADDAAVPQTLLAFVASQGPGSQQGFSYTYDDLAVQSGQTYWYWLEAVSLSGATTLYGPVSATVNTPTAVTLNQLSASPAAAVGNNWWLLAIAAVLALIALVSQHRRLAAR